MNLRNIWKANAAGVVGLLTGAITAYTTGDPVDPAALEGGKQAIEAIVAALVAGVIGWVAVYLSPKNEG